MKNLSRVLMAAVVMAMAAACSRTETVHRVQSQPIAVQPDVTLEDVDEAIVRGATDAGWVAIPQEPGRVTAKRTTGNHSIIVDIPYTTEEFSIVRLESMNFRYEGTTVHKSYNVWIKELETGIQTEVGALGGRSN